MYTVAVNRRHKVINALSRIFVLDKVRSNNTPILPDNTHSTYIHILPTNTDNMNRIQILDSILLDDQVLTLLNDKLKAFEDRSLPRTITRFYTRHSDKLKLLIELILIKLLIIDRNATYADLLTGQRLVFKYRLPFVIGSLLRRVKSSQFDRFASIGRFINTVAFLVQGTYPTLLHRLTGTQYVNVARSLTSSPESVSYEFQDRQLVWSALAEAAATLNVPRWWNRNNRKVRRVGGAAGGGVGGDVVRSNGTCPVCEHTVCNAHVVGCCGSVYCYICCISLVGEECFACGEVVKSVRLM